MYIDLHCHTLASDGKLTPTQLVRKANKLGFSYLAKTDHDNTDLMQEFLAAGSKYKVKTIPGLELSCRYQGKALHVVGLNIDYKNKDIINFTKKYTRMRKKRGWQMAEKLKQNGWSINQSELNRKLIARPHIALSILKHKKNKARLLKEFGRVPNFSEFITQYIVPGQPGFVKKTYYLSPTDAIKLIKKARGLSIICHPGSKTPEFSYTKKYLNNLLKFKFDGIEVYASDHNAQDINFLKALAHRKKLLISAGSDYHGYDDIHPFGICNNGRYVTQRMCQKLLGQL